MTTNKQSTLRDLVNLANANDLADLFRIMKLGNQLSKIKVVATGLTSAASFDITTATFASKCTLGGIVLATSEVLPPIGNIWGLRVVTGTATGFRNVTDAAGTPSTTLATLSDDGKTITFEAVITAFNFFYSPAPFGGMDQLKELAAPNG